MRKSPRASNSSGRPKTWTRSPSARSNRSASKRLRAIVTPRHAPSFGSFSVKKTDCQRALRRMEQRVTLVTLGVSDYARAKTFYEALGWSPALEVDETAFFQGNGIILALWGREKLGPEMGIPDDGARFSGIALAHNVR